MSRDYGRISTASWSDPKFRACSDPAKLMYRYLETGPHSNTVGAFLLPDAYAAEDLGWGVETVRETISELFQNGFVRRFEDGRHIVICNYLLSNPIENPNVAKAALKQMALLPQDPALEVVFEGLQLYRKHFPNGFETLCERLGKPFRNIEPNRTVTEPKPEPGLCDHEIWFDQFFEVCPKKVGRAEAEQQFRAALAKTDAQTLIEGMQKYANSRNGQDPTFTKTPAKWLLAERWKDYAATVVETIKPEALAKLRAQWGGAAGEIIDDIGIANFKTWLERCAILEGPPKKLIADSTYKASEIDKRFGVQLRKCLSEDLTIETAA